MSKIIMVIACITMLASCNGKKQYSGTDKLSESVDQAINKGYNAKSSLDYKGTYRGTLPTDDGEGVEVTIFIEDSTYFKSLSYIGKVSAAVVEEGKYMWNNEGTTITLMGATIVGAEMPREYLVGKNTLLQLDIKGKKVEGDLASQYVFTKD